MNTTTESEGLKTWAIVELMGHQQIAGLASEEMVAGKPMLRVDVPVTDGAQHGGFTRFYGASALYAVTPCDEEDVREFVEYYRPRRMPVYLPSQSLLGDAAARALPAAPRCRSCHGVDEALIVEPDGGRICADCAAEEEEARTGGVCP